MIVAITGGTGLIGKRLATKHLSLGDEVRILSRREVLPKRLSGAKLYRCDLSIPVLSVLNDFFTGVDVFYHCAGEIKDENRMYQVHIKGTKKLLGVASGKVKRWVQLSSVGVYGEVSKGTVTEERGRCPVGIYEETKCISDKLVEAAGKEGAFSFVFLQPSAVIAVDMSNQSVYQLIHSIIRRRFRFVGGQETMLNYTHADNVVHALYLCGIRHEALNEVFIVSEVISLRKLVELVCEKAGFSSNTLGKLPLWAAIFIASIMRWKKDFPLTQSRVKALTSTCVYSDEKIRNKLAYKPVVPIEQALCELVNKVLIQGSYEAY